MPKVGALSQSEPTIALPLSLSLSPPPSSGGLGHDGATWPRPSGHIVYAGVTLGGGVLLRAGVMLGMGCTDNIKEVKEP